MFKLPELTFSYGDLEPYIDAKTMEVHYTKHHQTYVDKLNEAVKDYPDLQNKTVEELLSSFASLPDKIKTPVTNHGGGHFNHTFFWSILQKNENGQPEADLKSEIDKTFGSFDEFKKQFSESATKLFGSGWTWLVKDSVGKLSIITIPNQGSPISQNLTPLLALDVWEHAYYLKYQNKRVDYIQAFWNVINWDQVSKNYKK